MKKSSLFLTMFIVSLIMFTACEKEKTKVTGVSLDKSTLTLVVDNTEQLVATVEPENAEETGLVWITSDATIASVIDGEVTGVSQGETTITVKTIDGDFTAVCSVIVTATPVGTITEIMTKGFLKTPATGSINGVGVDIICNNSGIPYLALNVYDASLNSKASTEAWNYSGTGTSWNQLGDRVGICDDEALAPAIVIKDDGTVYVAYNYYDNETDNRYNTKIVAEYSGTTWTTLGGNGASNNNCFIMNGSTKLKGASELAIKEDGTLMMILEYSGDGYVNYFTETKWESYNGTKTDSESFWNGGIDIATVGNKPYISIRTGSGDGKIAIIEGGETNGQNGQWEWLGGTYASGSHNAKFQADEISESPLTISSTGNIYTCYRYYGDSESIAVKLFDVTNSTWSSIYNEEQNSNEVGVIISNDILYLIIAVYDGGIEVHKYNSETNTWNLEGTTAKIDTYYNIELTAGINGEFFIAYECTNTDAGKVGVYKYTPAE